MNRKRLPVIIAVIAIITVGGAVFLREVILPRTVQRLNEVIPALADATLDQAARLTEPQRLPAHSQIMMGRRVIGELTLRFGVKQDPARVVAATSTRPTSTGFLRALESPDSSIILNGRLWDATAAKRIRADTLWAAVFEQGAAGGPIIARIVDRADLTAAAPVGFLWLPADSITLTLHSPR